VDAKAALMHAHRNNIRSYRRLLETHLTDAERDYIELRLSEERAVLRDYIEGRLSAERAVLQALQSSEAHRQQDKQLTARRADEPVLKIECEQR
jgi:hypothetical protein